MSLALLGILVAGCLAAAPPPAAQKGWVLDCTMGDAERRLPGASWAQDCQARASHTAGQKQELWLAVNPTDPDNVVVGAKDMNPELSAHCVWNGIFVTHDGGRTWKDVLLGGPYADRTPGTPYYGYACNTDPMGVFTADGTLHWLVELYNFAGDDGYGPLPPDPSSGRGIVQPGWKLVLAVSHDGGDTFPDDQTILLDHGDGIAMLNDYSRITYNPATRSTITVINTFYPGAAANAPVPVPVAPPVPLPLGGVICSVLPYRGPGIPVDAVAVQPVLTTGTANPGQMFCNGVAASADGAVALSAVGSAGPTGGDITAWFATSGDDGRTFSDFTAGFTYTPIPGVFEESTYRTGTNFELVYDNTNGTHSHHGRLFALTAESAAANTTAGPAGGDDADVYLRWSDDDGATWSAPARVNQDGTDSHQFMGNLAVAGDGSVHVFYMDKSQDPGHVHIGVTHAMSRDGGATWTNERVTNVPWDGELGMHQEDFPFIGDYNGVGAAGELVYAAFPDASNGHTTVVAVSKVRLHG